MTIGTVRSQHEHDRKIEESIQPLRSISLSRSSAAAAAPSRSTPLVEVDDVAGQPSWPWPSRNRRPISHQLAPSSNALRWRCASIGRPHSDSL